MPPLLAVRDLTVTFPWRGHGLFRPAAPLTAVHGISFDLAAGETLGIVGESGCGKSTLARAILQLIPASGGTVEWRGRGLGDLQGRELLLVRKEMQIVFQDPLDSLDPRMTVGEIVAEPLRSFEPGLGNHGRRQRVLEVLAGVGLAPEHIDRYPHQFSGGQCQRIGIARALISRPSLLVCDEPVSALDVSVQAQILNLLMQLRRDFGLSLIFISHNLSVVRHISQRIMVIYLGRVMEIADRDALCNTPRHPYTRILIDAVPFPDPDRERARAPVSLHGELPSPLAPPSGCVFRTRCPKATALCADVTPGLEEAASGHLVACHHPETHSERLDDGASR